MPLSRKYRLICLFHQLAEYLNHTNAEQVVIQCHINQNSYYCVDGVAQLIDIRCSSSHLLLPKLLFIHTRFRTLMTTGYGLIHFYLDISLEVNNLGWNSVPTIAMNNPFFYHNFTVCNNTNLTLISLKWELFIIQPRL